MNLEEVVEQIALLLERLEGCKLVAYQDIVGVWTIGFGETLGVKEGMVWTLDEAKRHLRTRVRLFLAGVLKRCPRLLLEPGYRAVACSSLAYNIGLTSFGISSVSRLTGRKEYMAAMRAFLLWKFAGGRVVRGLEIRRLLESRIYSGEIQ